MKRSESMVERELPEPEYLTVTEAARRISLSPKTLANLMSSGKLLYKARTS
jgi:hypothetical protein